MITIDNSNVTGVTINGDKVNEITMDGVIVWLEIVKPDFYIDYETSSGTQTQSFTRGALLRQFIMDNKTTFINNCKVVAKLPEITNCNSLFQSCSCTSLDLSEFNASNVIDMYAMFRDSQATSLDLSNFNTSKVTDMNSMFYNSQATSLDLSSFNTSSVTNMSYMFSGSQATSLDLSSFNTSSVTNMSLMFVDSQATSLDLSNFNTSNVTTMYGMFYNSKATSLDLSEFNTSKVTDMSSMFRGSYATTLDLSSFNTSNVTTMSYMFRSSQATTGYARTQADADKFNTSSNKPARLTFVVKPPYFYIDYETTAGAQYQEFTYSTDLKTFILVNKESFINHCKVVAKLPEITDMSMLFMNCNATSLDLSSFDTSSVTDMSYMFLNSQATTLDLSSFDTSSVTDMSNMFYNCSATTGYARTQADADRFNASSNKPAGLTFTVK